MKHSLKSKLSLSYVAIILICVAIVTILTNVILERQFKEYVIGQQEIKEDELIIQIQKAYSDDGTWDVEYLEDIGVNALEKGMILKIENADGNTIWDANEHNMGMCQQMLSNIQKNMQGRYSSKAEGGYEEKIFIIEDAGEKTAILTMGYYGPYFYTDSDLDFINTLNKLLALTGAVSIIMALVLGVIISRQISKPISRVIHKAGEISRGSYGDKIAETSDTREINEMITAVNNLAESLQKQEALSKQASLDIAHELRTPLTTVQGNLEGVIDGVMELDNDRLNVMHEEILRISRLVDDLGRLSKYESESLKLNKEAFDLAELAGQVIKSFETDFAKEGKTIIFTGQKTTANADRDKIKQVLINLIANAQKYTKEGGKVEVISFSENGRACVTVKDDGIGIAKDDLPMIFERFYRADKSRNRKYGGAGIGLTIVKTIINAHGGEIEAHSEQGKGTQVTFRI